jgi:hypothetical protein
VKGGIGNRALQGIKMERKIYIVGAHSRAQTLAAYLEKLYPEMAVEAYLYDNDEPNPQKIGNTPVLPLEERSGLHTDYTVYIGTRGVFHKKILTRLEEMGFREIIPVTAALDRWLRNTYLERYFAEVGREFVKIDDLKMDGDGADGCGTSANIEDATIYVVRSAGDAPLETPYLTAPYEKEIQAGAALTGKRLFEGILTDHTGDNISAQNRQFCELTALYWLWKHPREEVLGLAHYRRHFLLPKDWQQRMGLHKLDAILPTPLYVAPSVADNYKNRHDPRDWEYMMELIRQQGCEEYEEAKAFFGRNLYSPCNMFIMRREVLDDLCQWMFPILFAAAKKTGEKSDVYQNRYPGFLSERLMSFFFERHRERFRVVYADKNFCR